MLTKFSGPGCVFVASIKNTGGSPNTNGTSLGCRPCAALPVSASSLLLFLKPAENLLEEKGHCDHKYKLFRPYTPRRGGRAEHGLRAGRSPMGSLRGRSPMEPHIRFA